MNVDTSSKTALSRDLWFTKGVGIVFVVIGHVIGNTPNNGIRQLYELDLLFLKSLSGFIYSFHMPLFFIASGITFCLFNQKNNFYEFVKSKSRRLLIPLLCWSPIFYIIQANAKGISFSYENVLYVILVPYSIFWFINTLFFVSIFSFSIIKIDSSKLSYYFSSFFLYLLSLSSPTYFEMFSLNGYIFWNLFFALGVLIAPTLPPLRTKFAEIYTGYLSLACILSIVVILMIYHFVPHEFYKFVKIINGTLFFFTILILSIVCQKIIQPQINHAIMNLGGMSMIIYLLHIFFSSGLRILLSTGLNITSPLLHLLAESFIGIIGPIIIYMYVGKHNRFFLFSIGESPQAKLTATFP